MAKILTSKAKDATGSEGTAPAKAATKPLAKAAAEPVAKVTAKPVAKTSVKTAAPSPTATPATSPAASGDAEAEGTSLAPGAAAPPFTLPNEKGEPVRLADFAGKKVVLYFYPKDDTPGCTRQACGFRDQMGELAAAGVSVVGVSRDGAASHTRFRTKYDLRFPLLSDPDGAVHRAYGAWGTKSMYGKTTTGALRTTVLVGEDGRVMRVWPRVKVDGHAEAVLAAAR